MTAATTSHRCPTWFEPWGRSENARLGQLWEFDDDSLTRMVRQMRRDVEDGTCSPRRFELMYGKIRFEQLARLRLRMRYGATSGGTGSYDCYYRLGEPPNYRLAALMDHARWGLGQRHVLAWPGEPSNRRAPRTPCETAARLRTGAALTATPNHGRNAT